MNSKQNQKFEGRYVEIILGPSLWNTSWRSHCRKQCHCLLWYVLFSQFLTFHLATLGLVEFSVANQQLRGDSDVDKAQVLQWMNFADSEVLPLSCTIVFPILGIIQYNKTVTLAVSSWLCKAWLNLTVQAVEQAKAELKKTCTALDDYLLTRTYLVGERITLADIVVACNFLHLYEHVCDEANRMPYPNLNRWFNTLIHQAEFKAVIGDFKICEKECQVDPKKFSEFQGESNNLFYIPLLKAWLASLQFVV